MSTKPYSSGAAAAAFRMKKDNPKKTSTVLNEASVNSGANSAVSEADPVGERAQTDTANDAHIEGAETNSVNAFVTLLQELLRNVLSKFEPVAMVEFHAVLEREIADALEAKGACAFNPNIVAALKERQIRSSALKDCLNEITQVSELNAIKKAASSRIKLLTTGKTYRRKMIKGNEYLYEVYWDPEEKKKKYKYVGPATPAAAQGSKKNGTGEHG